MIVNVEDLRSTLLEIQKWITSGRKRGHVARSKALATVLEALDDGALVLWLSDLQRAEVRQALEDRVEGPPARPAGDRPVVPEPEASSPMSIPPTGVTPPASASPETVAYLAGEADSIAESATMPPAKPSLFVDPPRIGPMDYVNEYYPLLDRLGEIDHLSHNAVEQWSVCPMSWVLDKLADTGEVPALWNIGGAAVHEAIWDDSTGHDFGAAFKRHIEEAEERSGIKREGFRAADRGQEGIDFWLVRGPEMVSGARTDLLRELTDGWTVVAHEETITVRGTDAHQLVAIPDMVLKRDSAVRIVDFKTGRRAPVSSRQLGFYGLALIRGTSLGDEPSQLTGEFWMLRHDDRQRGPYALCPVSTMMAADQIETMSLNIVNKAMPPAQGDHCFYCVHNEICPARGW